MIRSTMIALGLGLIALGACGTTPAAPDGGTPDASSLETSTPDGSAEAESDGGAAPITGAPDDQWTWVDFPNALCASGTPTGIAINPHAGATTLMIYLEGGGDCVDATSCWGPAPTASNLKGYDAATFAANPPKVPTLNRSFSGNPFAAMNMVFVPYCTGDLHSGTVLANLAEGDGGTIPTYFYGARDMDAFLARLVPTFAGTQRVWLTGTSAGGFGTYLNFSRVATAFGVGVDMIDDSGPPIVAKGSLTNSNAGLFARWGTAAGLPSGCSTCNSFRQVLDFDLTAQQAFSPPGMFGFLSFDEDSTIGPDFGYDPVTEFPAVIQTFAASLPMSANIATFLVSNYPSHVVQSDLALAPDYLPWMTQMVTRNMGWMDETHDGGL